MSQIDPVGFRVEGKQISQKKTADESFETVFKRGVRVAADFVINGAAMAGTVIPGAAGVSAALSGLVKVGDAVEANNKGAVVSNSLTATASGVQTASGSTGSSVVDAMARMQESNQTFSMQYLELQEKIQQENRQYSTLSNILKTRHESAKTAIGNIR
jgi:hypothetical protein